LLSSICTFLLFCQALNLHIWLKNRRHRHRTVFVLIVF